MNVATIILAAGHGTRMKSSTPKVLHAIAGRSMLAHVFHNANDLAPQRRAVVIGDHAPEVGDAARAIDSEVFVGVQSPPRGTGDAVAKAIPGLDGFDGIVLVLYADTPFVSCETLKRLIDQIEAGNDVAVLGFRPDDPGAYGRLKCAHDGSLEAIIEAGDANEEELKITLVNSGVMALSSSFLRSGLPRLTNENAKREFYLTDLVGLARGDGLQCAVVEAQTSEVMGVNSRGELAIAEATYQKKCRENAMAQGVTLIDPQTVYFSYDTEIAPDVVIEPSVYFGPGVKIGSGSRIKAFSHIEGAHIGDAVQIGPFARLRPATEISDGAKIGNFVEVKKATLGKDAKVSHLSYIGDAKIGADANIGAGTITCNYDGYTKHVTEIGIGAFVGSNSSLVAPVTIGDGAYVGSGSVITKSVESDALAVARGRQKDIAGWATRMRESVDKVKPNKGEGR
ncbi:MAG: bifunctional UDP-N-acetylglucosamine diphosphorylase/glucosamine-1-phosphate N-acetyltransferase GlmU [Pseudomonadota bacterium]